MEPYLFVLDWDDTLFPTTWALSNGLLQKPVEEIRAYLRPLDILLTHIFNKLNSLGTALILTNATQEWIKVCKELLPMFSVAHATLPIHSVRDAYIEKHPLSHIQWKSMRLHSLLLPLKKTWKQLIFLGDGFPEYRAVIDLYKKIPSAQFKFIRFVESPTYVTIADQLETFLFNLPCLLKTPRHMDLRFRQKYNPLSASVSQP